MTIKLNKNFARNRPVDENDVRAMKRALNWLGYYTPYEKVGMIDVPDFDVFQALRAFQADHDLPATSEAKPGDETMKALNKALRKRLKGQG